jgi:transcriptional regulator with XRE-family HTH domain
MSSLAVITVADSAAFEANEEHRDYIPMILQAMADKGVGQRALATKTGISKSRLGLILHRNVAKRASMSLVEFQKILNALNTSVIQAFIRVETLHDLNVLRDSRFGTSLDMLGDVFTGLPSRLIAALEEIRGMDGTEVRREWAPVVQDAVVEKVVKEVSCIMERRGRMTQVSRLGI